MNRARIVAAALTLTAMSACTRQSGPATGPQPKAFGAAVVLVSGEKQAAGVGAQLEQALVVQVNDDKGAAVAGALVRLAGSGGVVVTPSHGLTGSDGQFSATVSLGSVSGHYRILASAPTASTSSEVVSTIPNARAAASS